MAGEGTEKSSTCADMSAEIDSLRSHFSNGVKVIKDVGDFSYVIDVKPTQDWDISFKFQIPKESKADSCDIIVRSQKLDATQISEISKHLQDKLIAGQGQGKLLKELVEAGQEWTMTNGLVEQVKSTQEKGKDKKPPQKITDKQKNRLKQKAEEKKEKKKPPMRTAMDVIKRILWDDSIDADSFVIGYIDRFRGVIEKNFHEFSWEDIASVDYDTLAIPKHRIQYFKYQDLVVWDKTKRLDNVFGSAGRERKTITEVIEKYEEEMREMRAEDEGEDADASEGDDDGYDEDDEDDDDDDDGIEVTINSVQKNFHPDEDSNQDQEYWTDKLRPNHFVAVRITNPDIVEKFGHIQEAILEVEPHYQTCIIPTTALHLTLCVLRLDGPEAISNAVEALKSAEPELKEIISKGGHLRLEGTGVFYGRVLYAKVHHDEVFTEFVEHLKLCLSVSGLPIQDVHDFVPHVTIMKTTRPVSRLLGTKNIDSSIHEHFKDTVFGTQAIESIHLCAMGDARREDGFYLCQTSLELSSH